MEMDDVTEQAAVVGGVEDGDAAGGVDDLDGEVAGDGHGVVGAGQVQVGVDRRTKSTWP